MLYRIRYRSDLRHSDTTAYIFAVDEFLGGVVIWRAVEVSDKESRLDQREREVDQWAKSVQVDRNRGLFADWLIDEWAPKNPKTWQNINRKWEEKNKGE